MKTKSSFSICTVVLVICFAAIGSAHAATLYWDTNTGGWNSTANWSTVLSGSAGNNPVSVPGAGDTVIISATAITGAASITLNASQAALGIQYGSGTTEGAGTINPGGAYTLTIGTGGIATEANAGQLTINANIVLNGNQTWAPASGGGGLIITGTVTGTGNLIVNLADNTASAAATNFTGTLTINGGDYDSSAFFNGASGGVTLNGGTVGGHGNLVITNSVNQVGTTNWYNNGGSETFSGSFTAGANGTFNDIGTANLTFSGATDNTNLSVNTPTGTTYLNKTSSPTVHAIGNVLTIGGGDTVQIIGTGGYQLSGSASVADNGTFDFNGDSESFAQLSGTGIVTDTLTSSTSTLTLGGTGSTSSFSGVIQNGAGKVAITKNGTGTLTLSGSNTYTGPTNINAGTLSLSGTIGSGGGTAITVASGATLAETTTGVIAGASSLTIGVGDTTTLGGVNTYSGGTTVSLRGVLGADDSALTATQSGTVTPAAILSASSTVTLNGAALNSVGHTSASTQTVNATWVNAAQVSVASTAGFTLGQLLTGSGIAANTYITGIPNGTNLYLTNPGNAGLTGSTVSTTFSALTYDTSNTIAGLVVNSGSNSVNVTLNAQGSTNTSGFDVLNLNAITVNPGATVNFTLPSGTQNSTNGITTTTGDTDFTSAGGQNTIIGGYATVGGTTWAVSGASGGAAGNITGLTSYNTGFATGLDVEAGNATSTPAAMTINSLRFNTAGSATVYTSGSLVVASGGILETSNVGASAVAINNNTITSGNGQSLIVFQNDASAPMTIGAGITNNGSTSIGFTKTGPGSLILNGPNTYTGTTQLNGPVTVSNLSSLGSNSAVTLQNGATLTLTNGGTTVTLPTSTSAWQSSSNWRGVPSNLGNGISYQVGANGGSTAQPDWVLINLGANYQLSQLQVTFANSYQNLQFYTANSSVGTFSSLFTANGNSAASPSTLNLGVFTADSADFVPGGNAATGVSTFTLSGVSGQYLVMYCTVRNTNGYGFDISNLILTSQLGGPLTQSVGSLASSDTTTSVNLGQNVTLSSGSNNTSTTYAGSIVGTGSLTKVGTGVLTLTASNTFTGSTTISAGALSVGAVAGIGSAQPLGEGSLINLGGTSTSGTLIYTGTGGTLAQNITVGAGNGTISEAGAAGTLTLSGTLTKANTVLTLSNGTYNVTGKITGGTVSNFNSDLDVGPSSSVTLSSTNNSYTGPTFVFGNSTLINGTNNALPVGTVLTMGTSSDSGAITNTYDLDGFNQTIATLISTGSGTNIVTNSGASGTNTLTLSGTNSDNNTVNGTFGGNIKDGINAKTALTVAGGTQILSNSNSYTGATTVSGGTLELGLSTSLYGGNTSLWTASNINVANGATLALKVGGAGQFTASNISALLTNISVANSTNTGLQAGADIAFDTTGGNFTQGATMGPIANSTGADGGVINITKLGANTLILDQANTYTGSTTVSAGTLVFSASNAYTGATVISPGATLQLGTGTSGSDGTIANSSGITDNGTLIYNRFGTLSSNVAIGGSGVVTKTGPGSQTLSANNSYTGVTNVAGGTLLVTGSLSGTPTLNINGTGTLYLAGTGLYSNLVNTAASVSLGAVNGGILAMANDGSNNSLTAQSSQTFVNLTLSNASTIDLGNNTTGNGNTLLFTGSATFSSFVLTITDWSGPGYVPGVTTDVWSLAQDHLLFTSNPGFGALGSIITSIGFYSDAGVFLGSGMEVQVSGGPDNGDYELVAAIPEPTTWAMMLSAAGMLVGVQRFRRRRN